jgi:hypothetical protein
MSLPRYTEMRKHARYSLDSRAKLSMGELEITVRMLDVSEGGLGVVSPVEIPRNSQFAVEFVFPTMQGVFRARVQTQSRNGFRYGLKFIEVDESNMALLRKYQRRWGIRANDRYAERD